MAVILKLLICNSLPGRKGQLTRNVVGSIRVTCRSKQKLKSFRKEIQDGRHARHFELLFWISSEPKGQLTRNMIGSIGATCRSEIAKIVPIGNPRSPPRRHLEKSIWTSAERKRQLTRNFAESIGVTCTSKLAKIFWLEILDGWHGRHLANLFWISSPELKGQLTRNLISSRSKIVKIVSIGNLENLFWISPEPKANWLGTW